MTRRILLVEDTADWREEISEILADDFQIIEAATVREAKSQIDRIADGMRVELTILDLQLSETIGIDSGLTVLAYLREKLPAIPCIVFTGKELSMDRANKLFRDYNVYTGLAKPQGIFQLRETVFDALENYGEKPATEPAAESIARDQSGARLDAYFELLGVAFDDEELMQVAFTNFPSVYDNFTTGMSKNVKIRRIVDYCRRHDKLGQLETIVKGANPTKYEKYKARLSA